MVIYICRIRVDRLFPQRLRPFPEIAETVPRFRLFFACLSDAALARGLEYRATGSVMMLESKLSFGIFENKSDIYFITFCNCRE
jgi:hypothetical protein